MEGEARSRGWIMGHPGGADLFFPPISRPEEKNLFPRRLVRTNHRGRKRVKRSPISSICGNPKGGVVFLPFLFPAPPTNTNLSPPAED